jgi:predicted nucleotide-binding protein
MWTPHGLLEGTVARQQSQQGGGMDREALLRRFQGDSGRRVLLEALRTQRIIEGNQSLAAELANVVDLRQFADGEQLITQQATDTDLFFILAGRVAIIANGREVARRDAGTHVGEMALIDPSARRSASVVAVGEVVVARVGEPEFAHIADRYPRVWRLLAVEMAQRLRQRNVLLSTPNSRPILFIGSSAESLALAQTNQSGLSHDDILVRVWTDGVFAPSSFPIEGLLQQVQTADFAALVCSPDDRVFSRGKASQAPRDNVIAEIMLFMGVLGRERTLMVVPRGQTLKMPTDLLGLTPITYQPGLLQDLPALLGPVCAEIRGVIQRLGCR